MRCRVTQLRREGVRLAPGERPPAVTGQLRIKEWSGRSNSYGRTIIIAELWEVGLQSQRQAIPPIADPQILATKDGGFILAGTELQSEGDQIRECRQVWLVVPA